MTNYRQLAGLPAMVSTGAKSNGVQMNSSNDEYTRLLVEAFDGERLGVVLGRELATRAGDPKERAVYSAFERVETIARNQLEPMISSAELTDGVQRDDDIEQQGIELAQQMIQQPRADAWAGILPEFEKFIGHLERLRDLAPADSRRPCDILVEHEIASVAMVGALIDGDLDRATNALEAFIATV